MKLLNKKTLCSFFVTMLIFSLTSMVVFASGEAGEEVVSNYFSTFWALVPPLVAIALALITK